MEVVEKTEGAKIAYTVTQKSIIFGDEDLSINLKNREMDEAVLLDVCMDGNGFLVIGAAAGRRYVAQIVIPAREYVEQETGVNAEGYPQLEKTAVPFDMERCTLYLWGLEGEAC